MGKMADRMKFALIGAVLMASGIFEITLANEQDLTHLSQNVLENFLAKGQKNLNILSEGADLENFKSSPQVTSVYFYKKTQTSAGLSSFLEEYDKSAGYLNAYGLSCALVDCDGPKSDRELLEACERVDSGKFYVYRSGSLMLALELETMFDVNSIMSNILQLALLEEVQIIQTKKLRGVLEHDSAGQTDVVYSYHSAIGTYEHRVFMEIAYAYQDKYKFVVSTEPASIEGLQDAELITDKVPFGMWLLYCRDQYNVATGCRSVNYRGEFSLLAVANYFKQLSWPRVTRGEGHPCESSADTPCIYILHSDVTRDKVNQVVDSLQFDVHGMAGLIVQETNMDGQKQDPVLNIRKPGGHKVTFDKDWNLENVEDFVSSHIFVADDSAYDATLQTEKIDDESYGPDAIDDMAVHVAYRMRETIGKAPTIPALTDKTFYPAVKERDLTIVLFHIPFDALGMLALSPFADAKAATLREGEDPSAHPLMRVDCFDWTDICAKENITTYPIIYIYKKGEERQLYRHALDTQELARTVFLLRANQPVQLHSEAEVEKFVKGQLPDSAGQMVNNLVLLNPSQSQKEVEAFKKAAKALETQMLFAVADAGVNTNVVPEGGVLHVRLDDEYQPTETLTEGLTVDSIKNFLLRGQFNMLPELTHLNFPELYARNQPFGILFYLSGALESTSQLLTMVDVIKSNKAPGVTFCKMTIESNPVAEAILTNYTSNVVLPTLAIVNHKKGQVHALQFEEMLSADQILEWTLDVQAGNIPPTKVLEQGEWKPPGRHYDFLQIIDADKKRKRGLKGSPNLEQVDSESAREFIEKKHEEDSDIRNTLLDLQQSRLYHGKGKGYLHVSVDDEGKQVAAKGDEGLTRHTEL